MSKFYAVLKNNFTNTIIQPHCERSRERSWKPTTIRWLLLDLIHISCVYIGPRPSEYDTCSDSRG